MKRKLILALLVMLLVSEVASADMYGAKAQKYTATAYCACSSCCGKSDGITATGTRAAAGRTIAVDPKKIPYGSTVIVYYRNKLVGIYIAEDCGGAIKGNKLDIFFDSHRKALKWGRKNCKVYVVAAKG